METNDRHPGHFICHLPHPRIFLLVPHPHTAETKDAGRNEEQLTNNITHELKTPIAVAYAANDALLNFNQAEEKSKRDQYLRISQEQLQRLSGLVEQILSMSMESRKTFRLHPEEICLKELITSLIGSTS